jgi:hypothetical protein
MPLSEMRIVQPAMGALIERWLARRAPGLRPATLYHLALTARSFLNHIAMAAPEIKIFTEVKHRHLISWMNAMATELSPETGRPLTPRSQRVIRLAAFFKDAEDWAWPDVPTWPVVAKRDLPRPAGYIPRYIPRADLEPLIFLGPEVWFVTTRWSHLVLAGSADRFC